MYTDQAVTIRVATPDDALLLSELGERTFREAFAAQNRPEDLSVYLEQAFTPVRQAEQLAEPGATFLIAWRGTSAVGYARLRTGKAPECVVGADPIELHRLYVSGDRQSRGTGSALMGECIARSRHQGFRTLWLGVWELNPRAIAFYRRWNFQVVGHAAFHLGSDAQTDLLMERDLAYPPA